jgi:membrane-associated protease RseP (regulator of RpoE activity)
MRSSHSRLATCAFVAVATPLAIHAQVISQAAVAGTGCTGFAWNIHFAMGSDGNPQLTAYPAITKIEPDSPAAAHGFAVGDTLVAVNGADMLTARRPFDLAPGTEITVGVKRGSEPKDIKLVLGRRTAVAQSLAYSSADSASTPRMLCVPQSRTP